MVRKKREKKKIKKINEKENAIYVDIVYIQR